MIFRLLAMPVNWTAFNRMRVYIFVGMILVVLFPMALLLQNSHTAAFQRELNKVEQAHLVIAENLASTLQRYAGDVLATFDFVASNESHPFKSGSLEGLLEAYEFRLVASFNQSNEAIGVLYSRKMQLPSKEIVANLRKTAKVGQSTITSVQQSAEGPVLYVTNLTRSGTLHLGAIDTSYLVAQQVQIAFGERGHAMIVDNVGRVMAHPKQEWMSSSKDVSGLGVVQRMTSGQTGVMEFFAPPLKADVIAGYTFVPLTGWGVMVPQPLSELQEAANVEAANVIQILLLLFLLALITSWFFSGFIAQPIDHLSQAVSKVRNGELSTRIPEFKRFTPIELTSLRCLFNGLLDNWSENHIMLRSSLEAAQKANSCRSEAISVLSHEMRTPLNGIVGAINLMEKSELSEDQRKYLGYANTSANTLLDHVNSVLEIGRLDSSKVRISRKNVNIKELFLEIVRENSPKAEQSGTVINLDLSSKIPNIVKTDARMVRKIAANIVGNAVKFTKNGHVNIRVNFSANNQLELKVKDTGPGIEERDCKRIFEPFTVIDPSYQRQEEGTGLGLSLVAMSVDALGGQVKVDSEVGTGSEFCVRIPVERVEKTLNISKSDAETVGLEAASLHPIKLVDAKRILVVDDNEINRLVICAMLEKLGHNTFAAEDGARALELTKLNRFDLILMDISMPGMDGTEVARLVREQQGPNLTTKIVAQTAHASPDDLDRFFASGMQDVLVKPLSIKVLNSILGGRKAASSPQLLIS